MKRLLCAILCHNVLPTDRRGYMLSEWRCRRCGNVLVSYDEGNGLSYCGWIFPRAKYEGMKFTVFPADESSDRMMKEIDEVKRFLSGE